MLLCFGFYLFGFIVYLDAPLLCFWFSCTISVMSSCIWKQWEAGVCTGVKWISLQLFISPAWLHCVQDGCLQMLSNCWDFLIAIIFTLILGGLEQTQFFTPMAVQRRTDFLWQWRNDPILPSRRMACLLLPLQKISPDDPVFSQTLLWFSGKFQHLPSTLSLGSKVIPHGAWLSCTCLESNVQVELTMWTRDETVWNCLKMIVPGNLHEIVPRILCEGQNIHPVLKMQ